jgi:hypothetical protein
MIEQREVHSKNKAFCDQIPDGIPENVSGGHIQMEAMAESRSPAQCKGMPTTCAQAPTEDVFNAIFPDLHEGEFINIRLKTYGVMMNEFCRTWPEFEAILGRCTGRVDVYWAPGIRQGKSGKKEAVVRIWTLWADVDAKRFGGDKTLALAALRAFRYQPSLIIDTGGGYHAYWLLESPASGDDLKIAEEVMKSFAKELNLDSVHDVSRILRVPGTTNWKEEYSEPLPVYVVSPELKRRFKLREFEIAHSQPANQPQDAPANNAAGFVALLSPYWQRGHRDALALALSGYLAKSGIPWSIAELIIKQLANGQADEELPSRLQTGAKTYQRFQAGEKVQGYSGLEEILAPRDLQLLSKLLPVQNKPQTVDDSSWYISAGELMTREFPPTRWLIEDLWGDEDCGIIGGPAKAGKTWGCLEMAVSIVAGDKVFGKYAVPRKGPVLYIAGEDTQRNLQERLQMLLAGKGLSLSAIADDLHIATERWVFNTDEWRRRVDAACVRLKPRAVFADPFIRMHTADENSSTEISSILGAIRDLQTKHHCAILLVHHFRKPKGNGWSGNPENELRGSSDLFAWVDSLLTFTPCDETSLRVDGRHRNAPDLDPFYVSRCIEGDVARLSIQDQAPIEQGVKIIRARIIAFLEDQPGGSACKRAIIKGVEGHGQHKIAALQSLVEDGRLEVAEECLKAEDGKLRNQKVFYLVPPDPFKGVVTDALGCPDED